MVSNSKKDSGSQAIVLGGSIAGLLSARVLSEYFDQVIVIEADQLPISPFPRPGVAQSIHPHILFAKGYRILQKLYPTIEGELISKGGVKINWAADLHLFLNGKWFTQAHEETEFTSFSCSRPLLEWAIRKLTFSISNIKLLEKHRATGLLADPSAGIVTGVEVNDGQVTVPILGQLVIDASGHKSRLPQWLDKAGFQKPSETVIDPFLGYATRLYEQPKDFHVDWQVLSISHTPPHNPRRGYIAFIENDQWLTTLGGFGGEFPPNDDQGYIDYAKTLASDKFYQAIKLAKPASEIYLYRANSNRLRHYENTPLPQNLIALGDSVCSLCPVYGQGMTLSAEASLVLKGWLEQSRGKDLCSSKFQKKLAKSNTLAWMYATSQDSRFLSTKNRIAPSGLSKFIAKYNERLLEKASEDPRLYTLFLEVIHQLKSPFAVINPWVAYQIFR
ncbi:FAD-dependent oxidoreductase [Acaryochloris marina]|uniref:FAD-binding domain-containing protein n=1 Tax=Acaryochloris marina (strain MBIC 11017) TaxID=329726 RepID=B0C682_ACAM1|nr:monooxygenase [Acaryochloris marina]ABW25176.1 conserved hypothetical protein [Acaryochloris marina MBIC11017]BDM80149.1 hypothetical protein AM10699_30170 [Acaryochloris marina MBIC10699]